MRTCVMSKVGKSLDKSYSVYPKLVSCQGIGMEGDAYHLHADDKVRSGEPVSSREGNCSPLEACESRNVSAKACVIDMG